MEKINPFKKVISEYILIFIVFGFILWLALGSITEFAIPLNSLKKISGTVSQVEHKASYCRLSRGEISECTRTIIRLKDNQSSYALTSFDCESTYISALKKGDSVDIYTRHWYQVSLSLNEGKKDLLYAERKHCFTGTIQQKTRGCFRFDHYKCANNNCIINFSARLDPMGYGVMSG